MRASGRFAHPSAPSPWRVWKMSLTRRTYMKRTIQRDFVVICATFPDHLRIKSGGVFSP